MVTARFRAEEEAAREAAGLMFGVYLTHAEIEALRDGVFVCTSADTRTHQAGRSALAKLRAEATERIGPRPNVTR